jgi:hypothetical protein
MYIFIKRIISHTQKNPDHYFLESLLEKKRGGGEGEIGPLTNSVLNV